MCFSTLYRTIFILKSMYLFGKVIDFNFSAVPTVALAQIDTKTFALKKSVKCEHFNPTIYRLIS